jgi:hypothetical protein
MAKCKGQDFSSSVARARIRHAGNPIDLFKGLSPWRLAVGAYKNPMYLLSLAAMLQLRADEADEVVD